MIKRIYIIIVIDFCSWIYFYLNEEKMFLNQKVSKTEMI